MAERRMSQAAAWLVLVVVCTAAVLAAWLTHRGREASPPAGPRPRAARSSTSRPPAPARPAATVTRTVTMAPSAPAPASRKPWQGTVVQVADGDTLDVQGPRGRVRVRLIDVDAPETAHGSPAQCGAQASKVALRSLVLGRVVRVVPDTTGDVTDRFGRALAYVELATPGRPVLDVGAELLRTGMAEAWHPASAKTPSRDGAYRSLAGAARTARRGNWATCGSQGR